MASFLGTTMSNMLGLVEVARNNPISSILSNIDISCNRSIRFPFNASPQIDIGFFRQIFSVPTSNRTPRWTTVQSNDQDEQQVR